MPHISQLFNIWINPLLKEEKEEKVERDERSIKIEKDEKNREKDEKNEKNRENGEIDGENDNDKNEIRKYFPVVTISRKLKIDQNDIENDENSNIDDNKYKCIYICEW